jgi:hypothetical protein
MRRSELMDGGEALDDLRQAWVIGSDGSGESLWSVGVAGLREGEQVGTADGVEVAVRQAAGAMRCRQLPGTSSSSSRSGWLQAGWTSMDVEGGVASSGEFEWLVPGLVCY